MSLLDEPQLRTHQTGILELCQVKIDEFALLGYGNVSFEDFWGYVSSKVKSGVQLHQLVEFILSTRITDYMNYQTISAYKAVDAQAPPRLSEIGRDSAE